MTSVLIASTIGLGVGIIVALLMDPRKPRHGVFMAAGIVVVFAGIGWWASTLELTGTRCVGGLVEISTPSVKGCVSPEQLLDLDPEVLDR